MSSKGIGKKRLMYSNSGNKKIIIGVDTDEIIEKPF